MRPVRLQGEESIRQDSERTCCNNLTFVGEMHFSHIQNFASGTTLTVSKRRLLLGYIHDFATNEQLRSDSGGTRTIISSISSCGRRSIVILRTIVSRWSNREKRTHDDSRCYLPIVGHAKAEAERASRNRATKTTEC